MESIYLVIFVALVALNFWATTRIIAQAGYSSWWILLPLTPVVLTIIMFVTLSHDIHSLFFGGTTWIVGLNGVGVIWNLDRASLFTWVFFVVFAFSRWPVTQAADSAPRSAAPPPGVGPSHHRPYGQRPSGGVSSRDVSVSDVAPQPNAADGDIGPVVVAPPPRPVSASVKHCVWCGESLPGSRALFHDCGPRDRPATHCATCGSGLVGQSGACLTCSASS